MMAMVNVNDDYTMTTAQNNPLTGGDLPIYILNSPTDFVLTTNNGAYRDYQSAILRFEKRYSQGWQLRSSLVWTDLNGNISSNSGYANEYRDKNGYTNNDGRLALSYSEWEFKLSGAVDLPLGIVASGQYTYLSGQYWTPTSASTEASTTTAASDATSTSSLAAPSSSTIGTSSTSGSPGA